MKFSVRLNVQQQATADRGRIRGSLSLFNGHKSTISFSRSICPESEVVLHHVTVTLSVSSISMSIPYERCMKPEPSPCEQAARSHYGSEWPMPAAYVASGDLQDQLAAYRWGIASYAVFTSCWNPSPLTLMQKSQ